MKRIVMTAALFLLTLSPALALTQAQAQQDVSGLWVGQLMGNTVKCHLEQRGKYIWGVAYVTAANGETNAYHLTGKADGHHFFVYHSSGHRFVGDIRGEDGLKGTLTLGNGLSFTVQAERTKRGVTVPGGLEWPPGYPPAN